MQLVYLYHSGFAIKAQGVTLVVDYYHDTDAHEPLHGVLHDRLLRREGAFYVLSSHFHPDHFNPEVLQWKTVRPDIQYIFSRDILRHHRAQKEDAFYLKKGEVYADDRLRIKAFGSTDVGVSFLIDLQGRRIFHAGDLNNWHWSEESTPEEIHKAEGDFLAEVRDIEDGIQDRPSLDLALFPVDSRMGRDYMRGATQFVGRIPTAAFAPMHFGENYTDGNAFAPIAEAHGAKFLFIRERGQLFQF